MSEKGIELIQNKVNRFEIINIQVSCLEEEIGNKYQRLAQLSHLIAEHKNVEFKLKQNIRINTLNHKVIRKQLIAFKAAEDIKSNLGQAFQFPNENLENLEGILLIDLEGIKVHSSEAKKEIIIQHSQARDHQLSQKRIENEITEGTQKIIELLKEQKSIYAELNGLTKMSEGSKEISTIP